MEKVDRHHLISKINVNFFLFNNKNNTAEIRKLSDGGRLFDCFGRSLVIHDNLDASKKLFITDVFVRDVSLLIEWFWTTPVDILLKAYGNFPCGNNLLCKEATDSRSSCIDFVNKLKFLNPVLDMGEELFESVTVVSIPTKKIY